MNNLHDTLAAIQRHGASSFDETSLADSHRGVTRRVRRDRAVRASVATLAGVGVVGAGTFGVLQLRAADALVPPAGGSPSATGTAPVEVENSAGPETGEPTPGPSSESSGIVVTVEPGERADQIIARLAEAYDMTVEQARDAIGFSLPEEARGNPEGWLAPGRHATWKEDGSAARGSITEQAGSLARGNRLILELNDVPRDKWLETLTIASIAQAEAHSRADMRGIAAVILNRLENDMKLQIESPLQYYADINGLTPADDGWDIDTPFNTFLYEGLPPHPINSPSKDAIVAAANPAQTDWQYFVVNSGTGAVMFATTFREHQENLVELGLLEPGDVL